MRLTCPNCGAQYEVPEVEIPAPGREVQCSNCDTDWFHHHPDQAPVEPEPEPEPAPQRQIDPGVIEILREEAARERAARAAEADEQSAALADSGRHAPDVVAHDPQMPAVVEQSRGSTAQPASPEVRAPTQSAPPSPRDPLPDIDAINSSLSASGAEGAGANFPVWPDKVWTRSPIGVLRAGFLFVVFACAIALSIYLMAPRIVSVAPGLEGPVSRYVAAADSLRAFLSQAVADLSE